MLNYEMIKLCFHKCTSEQTSHLDEFNELLFFIKELIISHCNITRDVLQFQFMEIVPVSLWVLI